MTARALRCCRSRIVVLTVATAAFALLWPRGLTAQVEEGPPPRMVRVHGVVREPDGMPAAGRLIRFAPENVGSPEATTGLDGSYSMEVDLRRPLWVELWVDGIVRSRFLRIAAPEGVSEIEVDVQLVPPIVMSGTITLPDGRRAADMTLTATGYVMSDSCGVAGGQGGSGHLFELKTDPRGRYTVALREGDQTRYDLYISQEDVGCIGPISVETRIDHPDVRRDFQLTEGGAVEGIVLAAPDGAPLAGATVSVATGAVFHGHAFRRQATTDEQGRFRLTALPPSRYEIEARLHQDADEDLGLGVDDGLWAVFEAAPNQREVEVREGRTVEVEIRMVKELAVTGRVFGPHGSPLRHTMLERMDVGTDGAGRFVYRIRPEYGPYGIVFLQRDITLTPSVPGVGIAVPVNISFSDAAPRQVDIHLLEPGALTGRASFEGTGRPVVGGCIRLSPSLGPPGRARFVGDDGGFEIIDMPPGEYEIGIREQRILGCPTAPVHVTVRPGETVGPLDLRFTPRPSFSGRIRGLPEETERRLPEGGWGEFGLEVAVAPAGKPKEVQVTFLDVQPDGSFVAWLRSPPTGRYDVVLKGGYPSPTLRVVSNTIRAVDLAAPSLDLQFDLHPGAIISGRVVAADGVTPLPYVAVRARPVEGDALLLVTPPTWQEEPAVPEAHTDDEGHFYIRGLLPGQYEVSVHWERECFGYLAPIRVELAERERRMDLQFRAARDWP